MQKYRAVVVTTWFPSEDRPAQAPFNLDHVVALSGFADVVVLHVRLGSREPEVDEVYRGVRVRRLSLDPRRPLAALRALRAVARATRAADVVHTMAFSSALVVGAARPVARLPWVHTEHWSGVTDPSSVSRNWERLAWLRRALKRPLVVTAVTTGLAETMRPFTRGPVEVVPCVVDSRRPLVPRPSDGLRLVAVAYLVAGKRPLTAVDVVAELAARGEDVHLEWIGDGPLRGDVQARIEEAGLSDRFVLRGMVPPQEVAEHIEGAAVFFVPTARENFFTAAAEAVSAGRPVVVAPVGGFLDYLGDANAVLAEDSVTGYADAVQLAARRFADVPEAELAEPVRRRFSSSAVGDLFREIYDRVAQRARR